MYKGIFAVLIASISNIVLNSWFYFKMFMFSATSYDPGLLPTYDNQFREHTYSADVSSEDVAEFRRLGIYIGYGHVTH